MQTKGCNPEMKAPHSGKISSLSLWFLKHSQRAERVLKKRREIQEGKSTFPFWSVSARKAV
ncbi:hypothetical protein J1786_17030 [Rahnella sp. L72c]|uniref:Uncharacterized protein n=1 Tax=Rahnella perminowiae TaxID=2816244 RepID=A0ABS6L4N8_9GAMM|nr:hypothetical protein [Rahnella perminowiae]MBU9836509.1 hypothetical protein [Rahnella perminowiae]